eukprot:8777696-Pyramimonas_sp.AAC.1
MDGGSFSKCGSRLSAVHMLQDIEIVSRIEGGPFSTCSYRCNAAHIRLKHKQELHGLRAGRFHHGVLALAPRAFVFCLNLQESCELKAAPVQNVVFASALRTTQDYEGAAATLLRGAQVPGMAFWRDSGLSRRNSQVDPWRWNLDDNGCLGMLQGLQT